MNVLKKIWQGWRNGGWDFNRKRIALLIVVLCPVIVTTAWPNISYAVLVGLLVAVLLGVLLHAPFARGILNALRRVSNRATAMVRRILEWT